MSNHSEIREMEKKYVYGTWRYENTWNPVIVDGGSGCYFTDVDGKRYFDLSSQLMCSNLGHSNQAIKDAIIEQTKKICYAAPGFGTKVAAELGKLLAEITPESLSKSYLTIGGAEANEAALQIARLYTKRGKFISRFRSYHGSSSGAVALTGDPRTHNAVGVAGVVRAPDCYCYRCPFGLEYPGCGVQCAEYVDEIIKMERPSTVAGVVIEPIVGSNGILVPPDEYIPRLREICDENDVLLIADEVMAGFGRTGKLFSMEHWDVVPDIMSMAKGISGAYLPVGATITSKKIADYFDQPENLFSHGQTYAMHPMACASAIAAINEYKEKNLVENAAKMGKILGKRLNELKENHKSVGDVRGKGLFWGVELVKDRETKEPFAERKDKFQPTILKKISSEVMKKGVYLVNVINTFLVAPPLIVTREEIDEAIDVFDEALKIADKETN
jgi:taurine---2-oxoglutarate transaminase